MTEEPRSEADHITDARAKLLEAALPHAPFDGWSDAAYLAAVADSGVDRALARVAAPRRGADLAAAFHRAGDEAMKAEAAAIDLEALRYSERVARLVRLRLEIAGRHREAARRAVTLHALPMHAAEGGRLIWGTADAIWTLLGDTSRDYNWYSKRAILSGVYSSTLIYWLGDQSDGLYRTWTFLDRRIADVMRFEKTKSRLAGNPLARVAFAGPRAALKLLRAPGAMKTGASVGLPGGRR